MDTEELDEIAFHRKNGRPETTKGPYYHKTWWESYKGAVKGIIGGIMIGGMIGAGVGGVIIGGLTLAGVSAAPYAAAILASTTLFGMYEGKEKFEKVGIATGAVAAANETAEVRMKEYVRGKFTDLTNEIRELKAAIAGKKNVETLRTEPAAPDNSAIFDASDFRSTHMDEHSETNSNKKIFWKVASIGGLIGAGVATIASMAPGTEIAEVAVHILGPKAVEAMGGSLLSTSFIAGSAALGASFGINRDIFRKIFDVTDCWFMGIANGPCNNEQIAKAHGEAPPALPKHQPRVLPDVERSPSDRPAHALPTSVISDSSIAQQQTTMFRDKILSEQAKRALLAMDHNSAVRH